MKYYILCIVILAMMAGCKKEAPTIMLDEMVSDTAAVSKVTGVFENGPYGTTMGKAEIFKLADGKYQLQLTDFKVSNGPDLKVYLSKEVMPVNFINLGDLKSTNGNQVYDLPGMINITDYPFALIHCKAYNHLFGSALLK